MTAPSSNWAALKKKLDAGSSKDDRPTKRRRLDSDAKRGDMVKHEPTSKASRAPRTPDMSIEPTLVPPAGGDTDSVENLRAMVLSKVPSKPSANPTTFLAMDCEMVGVGPDGIESALARVSIVNYSGGVVLDEYVRPQEPVTDYRTWVSGIRPEDMINAKPFREVQEKVAKLLEGRFLVGHALHNDLSALLLTHHPKKTRDTQLYAPFRSGGRNSRPALRNLVQKELGMKIQAGEHSSLIDARATMALYRLHKKEWEASKQGISTKTKARKEPATSSDHATTKGTSSGIATVTKVMNSRAVSKRVALVSGKTIVKAVKQGVNVKTAGGGTKNKDPRHESGTKGSWWQDLD